MSCAPRVALVKMSMYFYQWKGWLLCSGQLLPLLCQYLENTHLKDFEVFNPLLETAYLLMSFVHENFVWCSHQKSSLFNNILEAVDDPVATVLA